MDYKIRELKQNESSVLNTFLYEAIFIPDGVDAPPYEIINQPELQVYVTDFGKKKGDICYVSECDIVVQLSRHKFNIFIMNRYM